MTKQTAVEYAVQWLTPFVSVHQKYIDELLKEAKKMEKEKQKYFFDCGRQYQLTGEGTFKEVYNETYGDNNKI